MEALGNEMRRSGVRSLHSQAEWNKHDLLRFFEASGFQLAPQFALQRSVSEPLEEKNEEV